MSNSRIRWAVLGSGGIARKRTIPEGIVPAKNAELAAVYDINAAVNGQVAEQFGVYAAQGVDDLLADKIDAVYVATPANLHFEHVLKCARASKHVLCEKPLGITVAEAAGMESGCREAGVKLGAAFMMRFQAKHQAALKIIEGGKIGKPVYARAQLSGWYAPIPGAWRQDPKLGGGGALADMGVHCINLLEMFFGNVRQVNCFINNNVHGYESEDSAVATLYFENGAIATVDSFFCIPSKCSMNLLEIYGSRGSILARRTLGQTGDGEMTAIYDEQGSAQEIKIMPEPKNMYQAEIEEFSQAVIENRLPLTNSESGVQTQIIMAACYESARTGKMVEIRRNCVRD